jgi:DNA-binding CsgD family transcriptional regulator
MRRKDFMSNKDIAYTLQISENTVEQHMRKALRILKISFINHDVLLICLLVGLGRL